MYKKLSLTLLPIIAIVLSSSVIAAFGISYAGPAVGVEAGNWVEYNVKFTGTPMEGHDANWAKMTIDGVEGHKVNVTFSSLLADGTIENATEHLDFQDGIYIDYFVIPAGLKLGDSFFDNYLGNNVSVLKEEIKNYAGADRTIVTGKTADVTYETDWIWDQATGVLVEASSTYPEFTLDTVIDKTDLWAPQPKIFGVNPIIVYTIVIALVIILVIGLAIVARKKSASSKATS